MRVIRTLLRSVGAAACGFGIVVAGVSLLTFNDKDSMPHGWYVRSFEPVRKTAIVRFKMPDKLRPFASNFPEKLAWHNERKGVMKRVVATAGDTICRDADTGAFSVNGKVLGYAARDDGNWHALPFWSGCEVLEADTMAVATPHPDSVDSRYFGAIPIAGAYTIRPLVLK